MLTSGHVSNVHIRIVHQLLMVPFRSVLGFIASRLCKYKYQFWNYTLLSARKATDTTREVG